MLTALGAEAAMEGGRVRYTLVTKLVNELQGLSLDHPGGRGRSGVHIRGPDPLGSAKRYRTSQPG
jgi:hypothetical protein